MPKGVEIVRPKQDYLYIFDREIMKVRYTRAIGWVTVKPDIISQENVEKGMPFFKQCRINVKVYYNDGDVIASHLGKVLIFNPFGLGA